MMLSQLVETLNLLESSNYQAGYNSVHNILNDIIFSVANTPLQFEQVNQRLLQIRLSVESSFHQLNQELEQHKAEIRRQIKEQETQYYENSYNLWRNEIQYDSTHYILNRRLPIDSDSNLKLLSKLRQFGDWRVPGLIIRPGLETYIEHMVPLDPLYIVDHNQDLIDPSYLKFTEQYQRRLRLYYVNNQEADDVLCQLPNQQFGFIFCYNYFNYLPMSVVDNYIKSFALKLRPGGTAMFTFNDCDYANGVKLCEKNFMCYTPGSAIERLAERYGLEIQERYLGQDSVAWMLLTKPGSVNSLRGGQTLAKIVAH